jgi:methionyl-tRNA formyltransferase
VWGRPPLGTVNLHASLLPQYRGAAPINWAIINGERETGVTTFLLTHEIDTGDLLLQERTPIGPDTTAGELHDQLMHIGAALMVRTVQGLHDGTLTGVPQQPPTDGTLRNAPKIHPPDLLLDPALRAQQLHDHARGMSPFPGAWLHLHVDDRAPMQFKLLHTRITEDAVDAPAGTLRMLKDRLLLACADRWLELLEVQAEGKRRMTAAEFVRGMQQVQRMQATKGAIVRTSDR